MNGPKRDGKGRIRGAGIIDSIAECRECPWRCEEKNALAVGARHHDSTGHFVYIEQTRFVQYGEDKPPPGQMTLNGGVT